MKLTNYKPGDIISTEGLIPFELKNCKELGLKEGDLVVYMKGGDDYFKKGEVVELIRDDDTTGPKFGNENYVAYRFTDNLAPLPKSKSDLPVYETIIRRNDGLEFKKGMIGEETIEQITARRKSLLQEANNITGLLRKYNSITF